MRVAICTDIHGNRQAFEAVIAAAEEAEADELWCLGDLVGYGAEPDACVALAADRCAICLAGNHDLAVVGELSLEEFSRGAALAARWTQEVISEETREFLLSCKPAGSG
jgi:predicted phosphodiesterase